MLAQHILARGYDGLSLGLKLVVCMGEILYEGQKQIFKLAFGCPAVEEYGAAEVGVMAYSCLCGEIHAMDDYLILEILKSETGGDYGHVVVTHLENWASPLIRYNLEDLAAPVPDDRDCLRGMAFSRLGENYRAPV
jgi:phenylacetate-CoA ligase